MYCPIEPSHGLMVLFSQTKICFAILSSNLSQSVSYMLHEYQNGSERVRAYLKS